MVDPGKEWQTDCFPEYEEREKVLRVGLLFVDFLYHTVKKEAV